MTYVVHHLNNSRSQRVLWLLEELGLPYRIEAYARDPKTMLAPESLRRIHPLGKAPVLETPEGQILAESGAIVENLLNAVELQSGSPAPLRPAQQDAARAQYIFWLHYAEGSLMPPLLLSLVFSRVRSAPVPFFVKPIVRGIVAKVRTQFIGPQLRTHLSFVETTLAGRPWFAGAEFSAADIQMSFPLFAAEARAEIGPATKVYLAKLRARPAYLRAVERGGPIEPLG